MAAYNLEEQDTIDDLKEWWSRWGASITTAVVLAAVIVIGVQGWRWWTNRHSLEASTLYAAVDTASATKDMAKAKDAVADLTDRYARTGYAPRAALVYAKMLYEAGDHKGAIAQLRWVVDHASEDALDAVARYRIAQIDIDDRQYDAALAELDAKHPASFDGMFADLRGDALVAAGRKDEARKAYEAALSKLDSKTPYRNYVRLKLDSLPAPAGQAAAQATGQPAAAATGEKTAATAPVKP